MKNNIKYDIPNLSENAKDQLVDQFQTSLIKHLKFERVLLVLCILTVSALALLVRSPAVRFAVTHQSIATKYAEDYYKVESASNQAANEVVNSWVETGRIK